MANQRNDKIKKAQIAAVSTILANISNGNELILPNFSRINTDSWGYARTTFENVVNHLDHLKLILVDRPAGSGGCTRSILKFSSRIKKYRPEELHYPPEGTLIISIKKDRIKQVAKINTVERKIFDSRIKSYWDFMLSHKIRLGLDIETFRLYDDVQNLIEKRERLIMPDEKRFLPYIVFNDPALNLGGRFYGAFWIGCKKAFRKQITIDGELTADIDGKAMHVQLLYRRKGLPMPPGDPYIYTDERRDITKMLMLLMLNTYKEESPITGRIAVAKTYHKIKRQEARKAKQKYIPTDDINSLIESLENHHIVIIDDLYKPNWGNLQKTEAACMLNIMERGMADGVVILPVHDGCLCPRQYRDKVLEYFEKEGIVATENIKHRKPHPIDEMMEMIRGYRRFKQAA